MCAERGGGGGRATPGAFPPRSSFPPTGVFGGWRSPGRRFLRWLLPKLGSGAPGRAGQGRHKSNGSAPEGSASPLVTRPPDVTDTARRRAPLRAGARRASSPGAPQLPPPPFARSLRAPRSCAQRGCGGVREGRGDARPRSPPSSSPFTPNLRRPHFSPPCAVFSRCAPPAAGPAPAKRRIFSA